MPSSRERNFRRGARAGACGAGVGSSAGGAGVGGDAVTSYVLRPRPPP